MISPNIWYNANIYNVDNNFIFPNPPWLYPRFNVDLSVYNGEKDQTPKEILKQRSLELINRYSDTEHYYTDGSVCGNATGIGIYHKNYSTFLRLPNETSIFTAELYAILQALKRV